MAGVFISYRRADSQTWADRLADSLILRFGGGLSGGMSMTSPPASPGQRRSARHSPPRTRFSCSSDPTGSTTHG
jgi:hypothetical protein